MNERAACRVAVGDIGSRDDGAARCPLFIRLDRGVPGEELESHGYKVGWLSKLAKVKKAKKPPRLPRETPPMEQRRLRLTGEARLERIRTQKREQKRRQRARELERYGVEGLREKWRVERRRQKAAKAALAGTPCHASPGTDSNPGTGPAPAISPVEVPCPPSQ